MLQLQDLLLTSVAAFMAGEAAALVANLQVAGTQPHLDGLAYYGRHRIKVGAHTHAAQSIDPRKADFLQFEVLLGQRQQVRAFLKHGLATDRSCPAMCRCSS
jgi:hypothetical protein